MLYDYRKFIAEVICREFYEEFTAICRELGAYSRVQCHGAPTDLLSAYAAADVPESESLLFPVRFSRIPASAAALASKPVVSCETFTCIYGFPSGNFHLPRWLLKKEEPADLKLLVDGLIANGINQVVWHGMPFNPPGGEIEFYALVHVGPDGALARHLPQFNHYMEKVCSFMRQGRTCCRLAVYLPNEDQWMQGRLPKELRTPAAQFHWEMRYVVPPEETEGYHPIWISAEFLKRAEYVAGQLQCGEASFAALYVDCQWLDWEALNEICRLAQAGLPVVLKQYPRQPGKTQRDDYLAQLKTLAEMPNVKTQLIDLGLAPLLEGEDLPWYWAREQEHELIIFFANPLARKVKYPMGQGQAGSSQLIEQRVVAHAFGRSVPLTLCFEPHQSLLLRVSSDGKVEGVDIRYVPAG